MNLVYTQDKLKPTVNRECAIRLAYVNLHKISHLHTHYRTIHKASVFIFFIEMAGSGGFTSFA